MLLNKIRLSITRHGEGSHPSHVIYENGQIIKVRIIIFKSRGELFKLLKGLYLQVHTSNCFLGCI